MQHATLIVRVEGGNLSYSTKGMSVEPFEWNAAVAGAWNPAIFTPQGIARRLFKLPPEAAVEVEVSLDGLAPLRVIHAGMMVIPAARLLVVQPLEPSVGALVHASNIAAIAVESLPETPVVAAGVNLRFRFDKLPRPLIEAAASSIDDLLAQLDERTKSSSMRRTLHWRSGELNLDIVLNEDATGVAVLNYHRPSTTTADLTGWLRDAQAMHEHTAKLLGMFDVRLPKEKTL